MATFTEEEKPEANGSGDPEEKPEEPTEPKVE